MFTSTTTIGQIKSDIMADIEIVPEVSSGTWLRLINGFEQQLYEGVIRDLRAVTTETDEDGTILYSELTVPVGCRGIREDDIVRVYADGEELLLCDPEGCVKFGEERSYCVLTDTGITVHEIRGCGRVTVVWRACPAIRTGDSDTVSLPEEWMEMLYCRLRGECYKLGSEDIQAAKWLGEYNAQLESFRSWYEERHRRAGV